MFQAERVDWQGEPEDRYFGRPAFLQKDVNVLSERGLLSIHHGHKYLVVGVQVDIPLLAFNIIPLLDVSNVN